MVITSEPRLSREDHEAWALLRRTAAAHARTLAFRRRHDAARRYAADGLAAGSRHGIASSFGKDSMAMVALLIELGCRSEVFCHRDDMDFPGSLEHTRTVASAWGIDATILTPSFSVRAWIDEHAPFDSYEDLHGRSGEMARRAFYEVVDGYNARFDVVFIGTRKHESRARMMDRVTHGHLHRLRPDAHHAGGLLTAKPLCDWTGLDVYAYLETRGAFDLLPPWYRCIAFMHEQAPWRIREAWWLPEASTARKGGVAWLARYYPSLYRDLARWFHDAASMR